MKPISFSSQLIIVGGFLIFIFLFFSLTKSVYEDYRLEQDFQSFEDAVNELEALAKRKPSDVAYFNSKQYRDRYAKENLNRINSGERVIIIPKEEQVVKTEANGNRWSRGELLKRSNPEQWWEYFFGQTLSIQSENSGFEFLKPEEQEIPLNDPARKSEERTST